MGSFLQPFQQLEVGRMCPSTLDFALSLHEVRRVKGMRMLLLWLIYYHVISASVTSRRSSEAVSRGVHVDQHGDCVSASFVTTFGIAAAAASSVVLFLECLILLLYLIHITSTLNTLVTSFQLSLSLFTTASRSAIITLVGSLRSFS